ncbi:hypothetical protein [Actinoplanes sp. URMC 104]
MVGTGWRWAGVAGGPVLAAGCTPGAEPAPAIMAAVLDALR